MESDFDITKCNLYSDTPIIDGFDFVLGHGGWGSNVDKFIKSNREVINKCGLCIGGNINPPDEMFTYDALFVETNWGLESVKNHPNVRVAFGVNTNIFYPTEKTNVFDYLGVGSFAKWKRWEKFVSKQGTRLIVGEIQKNNPIESMGIVGMLIASGVGVVPNVDPYTLARLYNASKTVFIPSTDYGGGERAVLEARSCGVDVVIEDDNKKLRELVEIKKIPSHIDYAKELSIGVNKCL